MNMVSLTRRRFATVSRRLVVALAAATLGGIPGTANAQSDDGQIPGLIVSTPTEPSNPTTGDRPGHVRPPIMGTALQRSPPPQAAPRKQSRPVKTRKTAIEQRKSKRKRRRAATSRRQHGVAILVNDEPITHHEIRQRARLLAARNRNIGRRAQANFNAMIKRKSTNERLRSILNKTIAENQGRSRADILAIFERRKKAFAKSLQQQAISAARASFVPAQRQRAKQELIEERLKLQAAKRMNVLVDDVEVDNALANVAKSNKVTVDQFIRSLRRSGLDPASFKERLRTQISWMGVVRRKYGQFISINMAEIDQHVASGAAKTGAVNLKLHKITLALPRKLGQAGVAARLREGEALQAKFSGCQSTKILSSSVKGAQFKDLGVVKSSRLSEPERSLLLQAKDGEMLPPLTRREGVVLYAVCGRDAVTAKAKVRRQLQQREFNVMARRHLADLKRDAHIEYR